MAEFSLAALRGLLPQMRGANFGTTSALEDADMPLSGLDRAVSAVGSGIAHTVATPGALMRPNPHPIGSEEWQFYEDQKDKSRLQWAPEMALNMMGTGIPLAERGAVGVFGGRLAQTADQVALAKAEKLSAAGAPREQIWSETGWFKGKDDKWRFEIPDNNATFANSVKDQFATAKVGDVLPRQNADRFMPHPDLHAAYPDMWRVNTRLERGGGYPYQPKANYSQFESGAERINLNADDLNTARSMNLHELQHAIQEREGFAKGGDPHRLVSGYNNLLRDLNEQITTINDRLKGAVGTPKYAELMDMRSELAREIRNIEGKHGIGARERGFDEYKRLAGETEARNVETRRDFTAEQRRAQPPWMTQDVPDANQRIF